METFCYHYLQGKCCISSKSHILPNGRANGTIQQIVLEWPTTKQVLLSYKSFPQFNLDQYTSPCGIADVLKVKFLERIFTSR